MLIIERTDQASSRATIPQEYFWYLRGSDPEPSSYAMQLRLVLDGPLDRAALIRATEAVLARHTVFRTAFREVGGKLFQFLTPDAPRCKLELEDRSSLSEAECAADLDRIGSELVASGLDPASGRTVRGRVVTFGPQMHALILAIDHAVADAASVFMLQREILRRYARGDAASDEPPPVQYIDYAEALDRLASSPTGVARREWWRAKLRDARPVALPVDLPRAPVDVRRAAAPFGIIAEPMHTMLSVEVPSVTRETIGRVAAEEATSASIIYLSAFVWLLREVARQDDICIENVYNPRAEHGVHQLQGAVSSWTMMRFVVSGCRTLREAIRACKPVVLESFDNSLIPGFYETAPSQIRGTTFNYLPAAWGNRPTKLGELKIERRHQPFPRYKRHWNLMLFVVDSTQRGIINMTGNQRLWRQETIQTLARRYLGILEQQLE